MRIHGTLTRWNDERGFGFITPAQRNAEMCTHISAFPRHGGRPRLNEVISFEVQTDAKGKPRAVRVMRPGQRTAPRRPMAARGRATTWSVARTAVALVAIAVLGVIGYTKVAGPVPAVTMPAEAVALPQPPVSRFHCDGRTMCSQMTSCAEARYFLQQCPGTTMDGNHDGEPCERQWCH